MFFSVLLSPHRKLYLGFLTGPNWGRGSRLAGERAPHSVHVPLGRESLEWSSGIQAAGDWTGHKVFIFCGFAQASADRVFIESGPQTSRIRPCLATQREISVLRKKSCPLLPSPAFPLFHSPHVVSLFQSFPKFACAEEKSHVFLKNPAWRLRPVIGIGLKFLLSPSRASGGGPPGRPGLAAACPASRPCEEGSRVTPRPSPAAQSLEWAPAPRE